MPCRKKFKEDESLITSNTELQIQNTEDDSSNDTTIITPENNQVLALNLAARFLTARAQLIHQQVFMQQKAASLGLIPSVIPNLENQGILPNDPQQKLSQMLQIAQFQAYLASAQMANNKTETGASKDCNQ